LLLPLSKYACASGIYEATLCKFEHVWNDQDKALKMPWHSSLLEKQRDYAGLDHGELRMISASGQFVVVRVHQLISVSPNTSHPMLQIRSKLLHRNSTPSFNSSYIQLTPTQS